MLDRLSTSVLNWILIIGVALFIIEIAFFHGGMLFPALFAAIMIYVGRKYFYQLWGKIVFWLGIVSLIFSVLNMMAIRFLLVAGIILFIIDYRKMSNDKTYIKPLLNDDHEPDEPLVQIKPLFNHRLIGAQQTDEHIYKWRDINIHGGFGNRLIDLSNTVLPNDTAIISIRHIMGNIEIYVPYEVEVSVYHSGVFGRATIFGKNHWKLINQSLLYKTEGYDTAYSRVKIVTSLFSGDIEVKRI